ncbi:MAG: hypothetical protein ABI475_06315 [Methylophilaceae bacterium]
MEQDTALERVNYFPGQLLSVSDLRVEQAYFLAKLRRHNRYLHGWGVVSGLKVAMANSSEIVVDPGVAIDCAGNEIHVCAQLRFKIPKTLDVHFVVLQYTESETSPISNAFGSAPTLFEELTFTRIREGFLIDIVDIDPTSGHRGKGTGTPGCGCLHQLCIARLKQGLHGWKVELRGRRSA